MVVKTTAEMMEFLQKQQEGQKNLWNFSCNHFKIFFAFFDYCSNGCRMMGILSRLTPSRGHPGSADKGIKNIF